MINVLFIIVRIYVYTVAESGKIEGQRTQHREALLPVEDNKITALRNQTRHASLVQMWLSPR